MENVENISNYRTRKSYIIAYFMCLWSGFGGMHMFYIGKKTLGRIKLSIFIGSFLFLTGIEPFATLAIALILINLFWTSFDILIIPFWIRRNNAKMSDIRQPKKFKFMKSLGFVIIMLPVGLLTVYQLSYVTSFFQSATMQVLEEAEKLSQENDLS